MGPVRKGSSLPVLAFESQKRWKGWLAKNHAKSPGIWLRFFKKDSGTATVTHSEALDAALCHGWIDGQLAKHDEKSWLRKFTPRRPKSALTAVLSLHARMKSASRTTSNTQCRRSPRRCGARPW